MAIQPIHAEHFRDKYPVMLVIFKMEQAYFRF